LFLDSEGNLAYRFKIPNRSYAKDLEDSLKSGDIDQSSFAFRAKESKWEWRDDNESLTKDRRSIVKMERLYDVSPVTYPASPSTSVALRSIDEHVKAVNKNDKYKLTLATAKNKLNQLK
jgi:HK97 family phage prohead protease